jgi:hypothetical protein
LKLLVLKHGIAVYQEAEEVAKQEKTILIAVLANMETTLNQVKADVKELGNCYHRGFWWSSYDHCGYR